MKNLGGICEPELYNIANLGTKHLIQDYHNEVITCIQFIYYFDSNKLNLVKKFQFFAETKHSYGTTALFFSGGAGFGKYHFGVAKALYENDLMPRIISGSSVGSVCCAALCSHKYSELWKCFADPEGSCLGEKFQYKFNSFWEAVGMFCRGEPLSSNENMKAKIREQLGDYTFLEIYEERGWNVNINVSD
jgi:TAG lipase / steryl ester hydrolase / phospholipase A2 / LPA acyltransferase